MTTEPVIDGWGVLEHAVELRQRGEEFVLATVVWREGPSSGQQGSRAIVTATGQTIGWIGGACAEPVLIREAMRSLERREPRLLLLGASDQFGDLPQSVTAIAISCQSSGALQIFLEPVVSVPELVVVGRSPMALTLCQLASDLGWKSDLIDGPDFSSQAVSPRSLVVVATQGHGDEDVIEDALAASPAYLGVVGSSQRGEALIGYLADRNVPEDLLGSIRVPAGLDLGRISHREIAVAVLAELVKLRPTLRPVPTGAHFVESVVEVVDPVCGMTVIAGEPSHPLKVDGDTYYFCSLGCRSRYENKVANAHLAGGATC
ncbi:MAG: XdhC family protein [Acidimicrobiia bacterium]|nr:XdhC family protein [Actinomycetota bacterium]MBL6925118.1 XdhC family protein [Acidimicrobiia bacterium]